MPPTGDYLLHSARLRDARRRPDLTAAGGRNNRRRGWSDLPLRTPGVTRSRSSGGHRRHGGERRGRRRRAARRGQLEGRALVLVEVAADAGGIGEEGRNSGSSRRCGGSGGSARARGCSRRGGRSGRGAIGWSCGDAPAARIKIPPISPLGKRAIGAGRTEHRGAADGLHPVGSSHGGDAQVRAVQPAPRYPPDTARSSESMAAAHRNLPNTVELQEVLHCARAAKQASKWFTISV